MDDKDRFDALMSLVQVRRDRAQYRNRNEWKISFALWAFLIAAIYVEVQDSKHVHMPWYLPVSILISHVLILNQIRGQMHQDMWMTFYYLREAEQIALPGVNRTHVFGEPTWTTGQSRRDLRGNYSFWLQVWSTTILVFGYLILTIPTLKKAIIG